MKLKVAISGASGYVGGELARLLENHPNVELVTVTANTSVGQTLGSLNPGLARYSGLVFVENNKGNLSGHDIVFLALPHTQSADVAIWLAEDVLVLDCGADFRLESAEQFEKFYKTEHAGTWVYGLPELLRAKNVKQREQLVGQKRIAVPGCNATAITLAYAPLLSDSLIEPGDLVATLSVGSSGAGRNAEVNQGEALASAYAYQVGGIHRHIPEVEQSLNRIAESNVSLTFTPVLVPMFRGILAVNTAKVIDGVTLQDVRDSFHNAYGSEQFIALLAQGQFPDTANVELNNKVQIGIALDETTNRVTVITAIDNLVKGTAGAAIQSMNIALGLVEETGLVEGDSL
jgi:N-acetyl-gamma-glutamyl-phosphate reductase